MYISDTKSMNRVIIGIATVLLIVGGAFLISRTLNQIRLSQLSRTTSQPSFAPIATTEPISTYSPFSSPQGSTQGVTISASPVNQVVVTPYPQGSTPSAVRLPATGL